MLCRTLIMSFHLTDECANRSISKKFHVHDFFLFLLLFVLLAESCHFVNILLLGSKSNVFLKGCLLVCDIGESRENGCGEGGVF